jgi:hypothetical protein
MKTVTPFGYFHFFFNFKKNNYNFFKWLFFNNYKVFWEENAKVSNLTHGCNIRAPISLFQA